MGVNKGNNNNKRSQKNHFLMHYVHIKTVNFDPHRWQWLKDKLIMEFNSKEGKAFMNVEVSLNKPIETKW